MKLLIRTLLIFIPLILVTSCGGSGSTAEINEYGYEPVKSTYYEIPEEFGDSILYKSIIAEYSNSLSGEKIFLDPGHGGADKGNLFRDTSKTEADINLSVARHLKMFLEESGCDVSMTRDADEEVSISDRAELANYSRSGLMVSIHHNAAADEMNYSTNYTSTFYHGTAADYNYEPYEHSVAKFIQRDLAYVMRNPGSLASFDGTLSDDLIPEQEEYDLLYRTNIPAVLVECAFITNRLEETRLTIDEFNKIEAWGIFNGIAKFYKQDIPEIIVDEERSLISFSGLKLAFGTSDGFSTDTNNVRIYFNGSRVSFDYNSNDGKYLLQLGDVGNGEYDLKIFYTSKQGVPSKPFNRKIIIK